MNIIPQPRFLVGNMIFLTLTYCLLSSSAAAQPSDKSLSPPVERVRARDLYIAPGIYPPGRWNAITDVSGVRVGHATLIEGDEVRTGVTAVLPPGDNPFKEKLPAAIYVGNGFGKLVGSTQVEELGVIETPILLTNTLSVWQVADALVDYMLHVPGNEEVRSINPLVGETNDGYLNDIRGRHITKKTVWTAIQEARAGVVGEGSVGAGAGTIAFGWKGGIGTSSRILPAEKGGYTLGVLVQTNFGGHLTINGTAVWKDLQPARAANTPVRSDDKSSGLSPSAPTRAHLPLPEPVRTDTEVDPLSSKITGDGSCMIVLATDAPVDARQLKRISKRALAGMARTGSSFANGSGDYVIAFSTVPESHPPAGDAPAGTRSTLNDEELSPLFEVAADATEEAIYNSLLKATTVRGRDGHVGEAIPIELLSRVLARHESTIQRPAMR